MKQGYFRILGVERWKTSSFVICEKYCCVVQFKPPLSGKFPLEIFSETMIHKAWFWTISLCILSPLVPGYAVQGDEKVKYFQKENEMTRLARWYRARNWVRGGCLDKVNDKECNWYILIHVQQTPIAVLLLNHSDVALRISASQFR